MLRAGLFSFLFCFVRSLAHFDCVLTVTAGENQDHDDPVRKIMYILENVAEFLFERIGILMNEL